MRSFLKKKDNSQYTKCNMFFEKIFKKNLTFLKGRGGKRKLGRGKEEGVRREGNGMRE
jgi:hypothetical protein